MTPRTRRSPFRSRAVVVTVAAVSLLAGGCDSGAGTTTPTGAATSSSPVATDTPTVFPSSSVSPNDRPTHCADPVGDGVGREGGDLTSVDVAIATDAVRVTWRTTLDMEVLANSPSVMFLDVNLIQPGPGVDQPRVTFLVKARDGEFLTPFADRIPHEYVDALAPAAVDGTSLTATFPADVLDGLGSAWRFDSSLDLSSIADECSN